MMDVKVTKSILINLHAYGKDEEEMEIDIEDRITEILEKEFPGKENLVCYETEWIWSYNKLEDNEWKVDVREEWSEES